MGETTDEILAGLERKALDALDVCERSVELHEALTLVAPALRERDADVAGLTAEVEHLRREIRLWETSHEDDDLTMAREQYEAADGRSLAAAHVYVTALRLHYEQACRRNDALTSEVARLRMRLHERGRGCAYCEGDPCSCTRSLLAKP